MRLVPSGMRSGVLIITAVLFVAAPLFLFLGTKSISEISRNVDAFGYRALLEHVKNITNIISHATFHVDRALERYLEPKDWNPYHRDPAAFEQYQQMIKDMPCDSRGSNAKEWCDTWYDEAETRQIQEELWELQHPPDCNSARYFRLRAVPGVPGHGLGSYIHVVSIWLAYAMRENRTFYNEAMWYFSDPKNCPRNTMACFFWPETPCQPPHDADQMVQRWDYQGHQAAVLPPKWAYKGRLWWRAQSIKYLSRPSSALLDYTDRVIRETFPNGSIPHPIISLHVRHGDKHKETKLQPLDEYMKTLEATGIRQKYGANNIFISTEDPDSINELLAGWNTTYNIFYTKAPRYNTSPWESMNRMGGPEAEALLSLSQLLIAVECDFFVGTRSSNWCRLIDELRKVNGKGRTSYISPANDRDAEY